VGPNVGSFMLAFSSIHRSSSCFSSSPPYDYFLQARLLYHSRSPEVLHTQ
jgi:hypothetical protein